MSDIPLSLYVHFPWCVKKCPYCDFNSHSLSQKIPQAEYLDALIRDLYEEKIRESRHHLTSIFLGGGTPSLFSGRSINRLINQIHKHFVIDNSEITIEANPGSFDQSNFNSYRKAGVNRLSLGAQSFEQKHLESLGRIHNSKDIFNAYEGARSAGFSRINIDLMFGLPGQDCDSAISDLRQAVELGPEHISWYQLTIEPNTIFYRYPPITPHEDTLVEITQMGHKLLEEAGFQQYEVSAFALPGEFSQHNLNYWQFGDYIGIGAGAHGKRTLNKTIVRSKKSRIPSDYMASTKPYQDIVPSGEITLEFLMNALRLTEGFKLTLFKERTGLTPKKLDAFIDRASQLGLIEVKPGNLRPSAKGRQFLDSMLLLV